MGRRLGMSHKCPMVHSFPLELAVVRIMISPSSLPLPKYRFYWEQLWTFVLKTNMRRNLMQFVLGVKIVLKGLESEEVNWFPIANNSLPPNHFPSWQVAYLPCFSHLFYLLNAFLVVEAPLALYTIYCVSSWFLLAAHYGPEDVQAVVFVSESFRSYFTISSKGKDFRVQPEMKLQV